MSKKKKKGGRYTPPKHKLPREQWPRPPWFPKHWKYDPALLPTREQALAQIAEHEKL